MIRPGFSTLYSRVARSSRVSRCLAPRGPRQATYCKVVRNCLLLIIRELFLGKINRDDLRVFTYAVEHDLLPVPGDVESPHGGAVL